MVLLLLSLAVAAWFVLVLIVVALCRAAAAGDQMTPRRHAVRFRQAARVRQHRPPVLR